MIAADISGGNSRNGRITGGMVRIALWGNFGTHNLGNESTLAAAILQLQRCLPEADLSVICSGPRDTAARHGVPAEHITAANAARDGAKRPWLVRIARHFGGECRDWLRTIRRCAALDALIIVGTGILTDTGEGNLGFPYQLFKWAVATKLSRRKLLFVSVGVEAITGRLAGRFITGALRLADYRSYRDERCRTLLEALGFRTGADRVLPDLAFGLAPAVERAVEPQGTRVYTRAAGRTVAVGVYSYCGRGVGSSEAAAGYARYLGQVCALIRWLLETGHAVRLIIGDVTYDGPVRLDIRSRLQESGVDLEGPVYVDEPALSFEQLLEQLETTDLVIASRYHNVLLALLTGKPVLSLSYEGKNEELMRMMGLEEFCQTLDELNLDRLIGQVRALEERYDELRGRVVQRAAAARQRLIAQGEEIAYCIGIRG